MVNTGTAQPRVRWLLAATPVMVLLAHYAAAIPHEFAHSIVAWLLGIKDQPGNIDWGGTSLVNILALLHIDENVDYTAALDAGKHWQVALTAFAGPGLGNGGLFLIARYLLTRPWLRTRPVAANFLFWWLFMNLANLYDYVPMRVFASDGDVHHFILGSGMDPWVIYVVGSYLVLWAIIDFYRTMLPLGLALSDFFTPPPRAVTFVLMTVLLFGYFSIPSLIFEADMASQLISRTSVMAIPPVLILLWNRIVHGADAAQPAL